MKAVLKEVITKCDTAEVVLLENAPIVGKEKYLGGIVAGNGLIYCIPGEAKQVMVIIDSAAHDPSL